MPLIKTFSSLLVAASFLAGCAFNPIRPGMTRQEVVTNYGTPSRELPLSAGTRLQYSTQPSGQSALMVDLDPEGKVVSVRQVLVPQEFFKIELGKWTRDDMEREFGRPATVDRVASWPGDVMTYRWLDRDENMFFWAYLDSKNVVQRTGQGIEFPGRMHDD